MSFEEPQEQEQDNPTGEELQLYNSHMTCKRTMRKNTLASDFNLAMTSTCHLDHVSVDGNLVLVSIANVPTQNLS